MNNQMGMPPAPAAPNRPFSSAGILPRDGGAIHPRGASSTLARTPR